MKGSVAAFYAVLILSTLAIYSDALAIFGDSICGKGLKAKGSLGVPKKC